jgi:superfamily I DNA/RNA helicase
VTILYDIDALDIDDQKKEAVRTTEGPLLIIAAPGSGKTRTLVERVVHLVCKGIKPTSIMVSTFTTKAAAELASSMKVVVSCHRLGLNSYQYTRPAFKEDHQRLASHMLFQISSLSDQANHDRHTYDSSAYCSASEL